MWGRVTDDKREEDDDDAAGWCDKIASLVAGELTSLHGLVMMTGWRGNIQHFFFAIDLKKQQIWQSVNDLSSSRFFLFRKFK